MMRRLPNLVALRAFVAAAQWQSITRAADELAVTHAAVSRHVRNLETDLGVKLFVRRHRRIVLTGPGRLYFEALRPAFDTIARATDHLGLATRQARIRLAVDPPFAVRWLLARIGDFRRNYQNIEIDLIPDNDVAELPHPGVDAAIHYGPGPQARDGVDLLMTERVFPVCHPALPSGDPPLKAPRDLVRHRLLHEFTTEWWQRWLKAAGVTDVDLKAGPVFHDAHLALEAAAAGEGIAMGDDIIAADDLARGRLIRPFATFYVGDSYWLLRDPSIPFPALEAFRAWLMAACEFHQRRQRTPNQDGERASPRGTRARRAKHGARGDRR